MVDRDTAVTWIVSQPCLLEWGRGRSTRCHVPDLLTTDADGAVSLWDAKSTVGANSETFAEVRALTEVACDQVGWRYVVFTGLTPVHRHNLIWLHSFRIEPPWGLRYAPRLLETCENGSTLGDLLLTAEPEATAMVWHLIWTGKLHVDLSQRLVPATPVAS